MPIPAYELQERQCTLSTLISTISLDTVVGVEQCHTILRPPQNILAVEVCVECLGEDVQIDVIVLKHIKNAEASHGCHCIKSNE
jgi:hypothetical protein